MKDINRVFKDITGELEYSPEGELCRYVDVPPEVIIQYQKTIVDHLVAIGSIPLDEQGLEAMLVQLVELLDKDFISIGEFEVGDEIIASHGG